MTETTLPGLETIERISKLKNLESAPTIIMISGHATLAIAADVRDALRVASGDEIAYLRLP